MKTIVHCGLRKTWAWCGPLPEGACGSRVLREANSGPGAESAWEMWPALPLLWTHEPSGH